MAASLYLLQIILLISISFILTHTIFAFVFFLAIYLPLSPFTVSVVFFLSQDAAGISFLSYWSQSAQRREDIRMEREQEEG